MHKKICKNCQSDFAITDEDRQFYNKIDVPEPTWCPDCRWMRRMMWRNEKSLYLDVCDLCGKKIVLAFNPENNIKVYCFDCWWSDKWDPLDYAQEFDWSKPFFPQFGELIKKVPQPATFISRSVNSEYCNIIADVKSSYMSFGIRNSEEIMYSRWIDYCKDCVDCSYVARSELCYNAIQCSGCYNCFYIQDSSNCRDSVLCFDCNGCFNCFGCVGLVNTENYIFNQPASEEEYKKIAADFLASRDKFKEYNDKFYKVKLTHPHIYCRKKKSDDCSGNYFLNVKRCYDSYQLNGSQDCRFIDYDNESRDVYDASAVSFNELTYESFSVYKNYQCLGVAICWNADFMNYSYCSFNSKNCFGCAGLKKGEFSFFNKQYSEDEYQTIKEKIILHMKKTGEWGEFFPPELCPFAYNETVANYHFPLDKNQVLGYGWRWEDNLGGVFGKETVKEIPENIESVKEDITKNILACKRCGKNYKILFQELNYYKKLGLPIPLFCPNCRLEEREGKINPRQLWHRQCMCENTDHGHSERCAEEFETTYSPDRPEKVYCEECYKKEIY